MNIKKVKELEDLKTELLKLKQRYNNNVTNDLVNFFQNNIQEFKDFFISNGFEIKESKAKSNKDSTEIKAIYKELKINLTIPSMDTNPFGAYSIWELNISQNKMKYLIAVNSVKNRKPMTKWTTLPKTEDEKIEKELNEVKEHINTLKEQLESGEKTNFQFTIIEEGRREFDHPTFRKMGQTLEYLLN